MVPSVAQLVGFAIVLIGFRPDPAAVIRSHGRVPRTAPNHGLSRPVAITEPGMDAFDLEAALAALNSGLRMTLRTQLTSVWLPIQLGIIVAVAAVAVGIAAMVRKRFDLVSATMSLAALSAAGRPRGDEPSRHHHSSSCCCPSSGSACGRRWIARAPICSMRRDRSRHRLGGDQRRRRADPQPVRQPRGGGDGLDHRGAEHPAPARSDHCRRSIRSRSTSAACGSRRC